ncbi:MAG TPA: DNA polymerase I [Kofleriaceae bacterium]|nr:DNA polymerase I [Kofleriaceae bacterium]
MERIYILDGHGYVFRAHYGLMNSSRGEKKEVRLSRSDGMPTGALYVFARMLMRLHEDVRPERMVVVFDTGRKNFRSEIFPEYKANRGAPPEDLQVQMEYFRPIVEGFRWPVLAVPGVEADDVIATLVKKARERNWEAVIYSADKDLTQLVGDGVSMIDALHQKTYTREAVIAKYGVPPEQVADFLALIGDTSDNIPGMPGVGEKTAATLLQTYGSIERLIAENPVVPRLKVKQPFGDPETIERVRLSRKLVELQRDVPLPRELDELRARPWDTDALHALFKELEFQLLIDKLETTVPPVVEVIEDLPVAETTVSSIVPELAADAASIASFAEAARAAGRMSVIVETDNQRPDRAHVVGVACAVPGRAVYVPIAHVYIGAPRLDDAALAPLYAVFADASIKKIVHDGKTATRVLGTLNGIVEDTMIAAFLIDATKDAEPSGEVISAAAHVVLEPRGDVLGKAKSMEPIEVERATAWDGRVAGAALAASAEQGRLLARSGLDRLYREIELPIAELLVLVERTGITIDAAHFRKLNSEVGATIAALEQQVWGAIGEEINLGSPKQLGALLFDKLGLSSEKMKKTKTGYSVDHEVLESLIDDHPAIKPILEQRELVKLRGTYLEALPPLVNPKTGRLHTTFNQVVAATGRISSQDPNLQNIPIKTEMGRAIRRGFIAAPGKLIVAADYSQIELRILAHLSGDPVLGAAFRDRIDVHTQTAAEVFGVAREEVTALQRRVAKAVNYGLAYGQSDFGLARALDIPRKEASEYSQKYFERFPTVRNFMDGLVAEARTRGGSRTLLGRWRPIPDLRSKSPMARRQAERIAQNTPMQGAGADLIKLAMLKTHARIAREQLDASLLLTVHDELVFEVAADRAEQLGAIVKEEMEHVYELAVPLEVDVGIGPNWAEC